MVGPLARKKTRQGVEYRHAKGILPRNPISGQDAPSALRVANPSLPSKLVDGFRQLDALLHYASDQSLGQRDRAGLPKGLAALTITNVCPVLEKHPALPAVLDDFEPTLQAHKISPGQPLLSGDSHQLLPT